MKKPFVVRAYYLGQHMLPAIKMNMETKDLAIALAEVLLEERFHYVTIINHASNEDVMEFKKELVLK